jgi:nucleoside-diphosphate-sugar epimerase
MRQTIAALNHLDQAVTAAGGIALRYGNFYGDPNDGLVAAVRVRKFPIVGDGGGVWSHIHLEDAAAATVLALERDGPAVYNIVDDEPAPAGVWLPELAKILGAAPPALPASAGPALRWGSARGHGHRVARRLQRQGQARARLDAPLPQLAPRLHSGLRPDETAQG